MRTENEESPPFHHVCPSLRTKTSALGKEILRITSILSTATTKSDSVQIIFEIVIFCQIKCHKGVSCKVVKLYNIK